MVIAHVYHAENLRDDKFGICVCVLAEIPGWAKPGKMSIAVDHSMELRYLFRFSCLIIMLTEIVCGIFFPLSR
jgi:hypothetical protein